MKTVAAEMQPSLDAVLDSAQKERVVLTRDGKPSAVVVGVESYDAEDLQLATSPDFWKMIESRRRGGRMIPLAEVRASLKIPRKHRAKSRSTKLK